MKTLIKSNIILTRLIFGTAGESPIVKNINIKLTIRGVDNLSTENKEVIIDTVKTLLR
jgi:hypothetical protein